MSQLFQGHRQAILLVAILLTISAATFIRPALILYRQNKANELLMHITSPYSGMAVCEIPNQLKQEDNDQLLEAIKLLEQAIQTAPKTSHSYLLLGQLYCLTNDPTQAINALKTYIELRPNSPLGYLEMGFAQYKQCILKEQQDNGAVSLTPISGDPSPCLEKDLLEEIQASWLSIGLKPEQFITSAHQSFELKNYPESAIWFQRALKYPIGSIDALPKSDLYMWALSKMMSDGNIPDIISTRLPILEISNTTTINADQMHWFREIPSGVISYGDNVKLKSIDQRLAGIVNWNGPVGAFIYFSQDGWYTVSVQAQNTVPAPVILQLEKELEPFGIINLDRGDLSWEVFQFRVHIEKGIQLLTINFINDAIVDEMDRNAVIEWIKLDRDT